MLPRVASSGGMMLIVRFEEPGGRYTAKTHVVSSRAARAPTDMPWWRAALLPAALERLNLEKRRANECLVKSELRSALRGYDSIIDAINVALAAPRHRPRVLAARSPLCWRGRPDQLAGTDLRGEATGRSWCCAAPH